MFSLVLSNALKPVSVNLSFVYFTRGYTLGTHVNKVKCNEENREESKGRTGQWEGGTGPPSHKHLLMPLDFSIPLIYVANSSSPTFTA